MKTRFIFYFFVLASHLFSSIECPAQRYFAYHPLAASLSIGRNFDLFEIGEPKISTFLSSWRIDTSNRNKEGEFRFQLSAISDAESIRKTFQIDTRLEASFPGFSLNANFGINESQYYSSKSFSLCLIAKKDYGKELIIDPVPDDKAVALMVTNREQFRQTYGEYIVSGVRREQDVYIIITIYNEDEQFRKETYASLSVKAGSPITVSAAIEARLKSVLDQVRSSKRFNISAISHGGKEFVEETTLASNIYNDINSGKDFVGSALERAKAFMHTFSYENSNVVGFFYSPLSQFGYRNPEYFGNLERKYEKLIALNKFYQRAHGLRELISQISELPLYSYVGQFDKNVLESDNELIDIFLDQQAAAIVKCKADDCGILMNCCKSIKYPFNEDQESIVTNIYKRYALPFDGFNFYQSGRSNVHLRNGSGTIWLAHTSNIALMNLATATTKLKLKVYIAGEVMGAGIFRIDVLVNGQPMPQYYIMGNGEVGPNLFNPRVGAKAFSFIKDYPDIPLIVNGRPLQDIAIYYSMQAVVNGVTNFIAVENGSYASFELQ